MDPVLDSLLRLGGFVEQFFSNKKIIFFSVCIYYIICLASIFTAVPIPRVWQVSQTVAWREDSMFFMLGMHC